MCHCYLKALSYASMGDGFDWTEFNICTYFCLSERMVRFVLCFSPKLIFILKQAHLDFNWTKCTSIKFRMWLQKKRITSRKAQASWMCSYPFYWSNTVITFHRYSWSRRHLLLVFGLSFIVKGRCILLNPLVYGVSHNICNLLKMAFRYFIRHFFWVTGADKILNFNVRRQ